MLKLEKLSSLKIYNGVYFCNDPTVKNQIKELEEKLILPPIERPKKTHEKMVKLYRGEQNIPKLCPAFINDYVEETKKVGRKKVKELVAYRDEETIAYRKALIDRHLRESFIQRETGLYDCALVHRGGSLGQLICNISGFTALRRPQDFYKLLDHIIKRGIFPPEQKEISLSGKLEITETQRQVIIDVLASTEFCAISEATLNEFYYLLPAIDATVKYKLDKLLSEK